MSRRATGTADVVALKVLARKIAEEVIAYLVSPLVMYKSASAHLRDIGLGQEGGGPTQTRQSRDPKGGFISLQPPPCWKGFLGARVEDYVQDGMISVSFPTADTSRRVRAVGFGVRLYGLVFVVSCHYRRFY